MPDHIDRAAKVIADFNACGHCEGTCGACRGEAETLADAGLLASPEHEAAVAARALRALADETSERHASSLFTGGADRPYGWGAVSILLREEADRIEREGEAS